MKHSSPTGRKHELRLKFRRYMMSLQKQIVKANHENCKARLMDRYNEIKKKYPLLLYSDHIQSRLIDEHYLEHPEEIQIDLLKGTMMELRCQSKYCYYCPGKQDCFQCKDIDDRKRAIVRGII